MILCARRRTGKTDPDAAAVAKFRSANRGAPHLLIVSSSDQDGAALASKLGYGDCNNTVSGAREISVCRVSTPPGVAHE